MLSRAFILFGTLAIGLWIGGASCGFTETDTSEGDRCNPLDSHNECKSGLVCTGQGSSPTIPFCPENYCCSVDSTGAINSTNPNCQPGCNGGAASICHADKDPGACSFADGGSLSASLALDEEGGPTTPDSGGSTDAHVEADSETDARSASDAESASDVGTTTDSESSAESGAGAAAEASSASDAGLDASSADAGDGGDAGD